LYLVTHETRLLQPCS